jgi:hypothetical protein
MRKQALKSGHSLVIGAARFVTVVEVFQLSRLELFGC